MQNQAFAEGFIAAKQRLNRMQIRFVAEPDQLRQALLEIYCAVALGTRYNDFGDVRRAMRETTSSAPAYGTMVPLLYEFGMRFLPRKPSRLDTLIAALGGTAEAARLFGRHPSTICRWRSGERPLPATVAKRMRELAMEIDQEMIQLAYALKTDIRKGEERALRPRGFRRHSARGGYSPERWALMNEEQRAHALELFRLREIDRGRPRDPFGRYPAPARGGKTG
jgi:hypothetical protein